MPPSAMVPDPPGAEINKLIDEVFVTQGAAINCGALRRLLQQLTATMQPGSGAGPCGCCCSVSRITIDGRSLKKSNSKTNKPKPSSSKTGVGGARGKEKSDADREHEMILSKLQNLQTMLKSMQQKINKIETRLPKSQSNVSLGRGGGRQGQTSKASSIRFSGGRGGGSKIAKKHFCGASGSSGKGVGPSSLKAGSNLQGRNPELSGSQLIANIDRTTGECLCSTRRRLRNASKVKG
uniref:Uncharacterized protein n=1 Tax=Anopheles culicifacies TaxID=139723 RepID=A0A182M5Q6_9DIPT